MVISRLYILIMILLLVGCVTRNQTNEPTIHTEYVEVKVPVIYKLDRPSRPRLTNKKTIPGYLSEVMAYVNRLEVIIDEASTKGKVN